jgi:catechol 2,3-dioxygenase-like lactoylglutathione lyase family enzyme
MVTSDIARLYDDQKPKIAAPALVGLSTAQLAGATRLLSNREEAGSAPTKIIDASITRRGQEMTNPANATHLRQVATVFVPVADQDRALNFYLDKLGFEKRVDFPYGNGSRWIEVAPPGSSNTISLVPQSEGKSAGGDEAHCAFMTDDIEADHRALRARGVAVDTEIARKGKHRSGLVSIEASIGDPVPSQFFFRDPDGNRFLIVQPD